FIKDELAFRNPLYPPFQKMLKVMSSHAKEEKAKERIENVANMALKFRAIEVVGHGKAGVAKIAGKYRYELLVRSPSTKALLEFAHVAKALHVEIDMDPLSFS
ncbi:MAG: primosomal protein N', partial [Campylobacterales bacterium]|nr:primosomal protein N' [Campylobacterales bacterium]